MALTHKFKYVSIMYTLLVLLVISITSIVQMSSSNQTDKTGVAGLVCGSNALTFLSLIMAMILIYTEKQHTTSLIGISVYTMLILSLDVWYVISNISNDYGLAVITGAIGIAIGLVSGLSVEVWNFCVMEQETKTSVLKVVTQKP